MCARSYVSIVTRFIKAIGISCASASSELLRGFFYYFAIYIGARGIFNELFVFLLYRIMCVCVDSFYYRPRGYVTRLVCQMCGICVISLPVKLKSYRFESFGVFEYLI